MPQSTMSSRERMIRAIKRERPDHVPLCLHINHGPWFQEPLYWRDQFERAERMLELGIDPSIDIWMPEVRPHRDVTIQTWREKKNGEVLLTKEFHTPAGVLRQTVHESEDWTSPLHGPWIRTTFGGEKRTEYGIHLFDDHNVSRRTEPWVKGPEDLEKLRYVIRVPDGWVLDEWRMDAERALEYARKRDLLTVFRRTIVGDAFQWFCDIPWFMTQLYDNPGFVEEFLRIFQDWSLRLVELALEVGVDMVQYRGWYEISTYWGVKGFERYLVPIIEEQARMVHAAGKLFGYFLPASHGVFARILRDLEADVLMAIDPRMLELGTLKDLFDQVGDRKSFWGGVDNEITLESQNPVIIEKAVKYAIESLAGKGGLVLSAMIFQETPVQSMLHMIDAWRKHCHM